MARRDLTLTDSAAIGLFYIQRYQFLTIDQFTRAASMKRPAASEQLRELERHGILGHFGNIGMPGIGKTPKVYFLKRKGWELLTRESGIPPELIGALLGAELTMRQGVIFRYLARLMMVVPGGTIHTFMDFMENPEATHAYFGKLDRLSRHFFETQFPSPAFKDTRQQILARLWGVLSNSVLERMFANPQNKLDLFHAMNNGSLILFNTAKDLLKQEGCEILGRFFIALVCQAAQERASIPENKRQNTFLYIDEAHDYFDQSMENLLNQARKYKVGLILAHQNLDQFPSKLRSTVMASTSLKLVGGLSASDANAFAKEMHCEREYLQGMNKHADHTEFACFVRNHTPIPIRLNAPFGTMEARTRISEADYAEIIARNRLKYAAGDGEQGSDPKPPSSGPSGFELGKPEVF